MPQRRSSGDVDRAAARWAARLDRGPLTSEEQLGLDRWTAGDARRAGALARAMAVLAAFEGPAAPEAAPVRPCRTP